MKQLQRIRTLTARARNAVPFVPLLIPGWNITCWGIGYAYFRFSGNHRTKTVTDAFKEVVLAPAVPYLVFMDLLQRRQLAKAVTTLRAVADRVEDTLDQAAQ